MSKGFDKFITQHESEHRMNYIIGSAVKIKCEIDSDKVASTTLTLDSLIDSAGAELASDNAMSYAVDDDDANIGSVTWQSTLNTNPTGKYTYIIKAVNGGINSFAKGYFLLAERKPS